MARIKIECLAGLGVREQQQQITRMSCIYSKVNAGEVADRSLLSNKLQNKMFEVKDPVTGNLYHVMSKDNTAYHHPAVISKTMDDISKMMRKEQITKRLQDKLAQRKGK